MPLDYEILSRALGELELELGPSQSWTMITEESGVANVKNIAEGRFKPSIESWQQLHRAFPGKIPPPQMVDGEVIRDKSVQDFSKSPLF